MELLAEEDTEGPPWKFAKKAASRSNLRFKMGAALVSDGIVVSYAPNSKKTHPEGSGRYKTLHSEIYAIKKALRRGYNIEGSILYVYRRYGRLAKPCEDCQKFLKEHGIKRVVYSI